MTARILSLDFVYEDDSPDARHISATVAVSVVDDDYVLKFSEVHIGEYLETVANIRGHLFERLEREAIDAYEIAEEREQAAERRAQRVVDECRALVAPFVAGGSR